jgi:hypothetical protein
MKLEVGKYYKTAEGQKAKVILIAEESENLHMSVCAIVYAENGDKYIVVYSLDGESGHYKGGDIVSLWENEDLVEKI